MRDNVQGVIWGPPGSGDDPIYPQQPLQTDAAASLGFEDPQLTDFPLQVQQQQFQQLQQPAALPSLMNFASSSPHANISNSGIDPLALPLENAPAPPAPTLSGGAAVELGLGQLEHRLHSPPLIAPTGYLGVSTFQLPIPPAGSWPAMAYNAHPNQQLPANDLADAHAYKASSSPEPRDNQGTPDKPHRRGYQACQNCRSRKVKCDLGSVDAPTEPPCKRCLRERLECRFAATRKKQKRLDGTARDVSTTSDNAETSVNDGAVHHRLIREPQQSPALHATNGLSRQSWSPNMSNNSRASYTSQPRVDPHHSRGSSMYPGVAANKIGSDVHLHSQAAAATLGGQVSTAQDSLMALVDAAHVFETSAPGDKESPLSDRGGRKGNKISSLGHGGPEEPSGVGLSPAEQAEQEAGMKAWSQMRFVRNGWFTAWEAMQYVAYFYDNLAPMTPVVFPDFKSPVRHHTLLADEPILALAILAIASRHMPLSGNAAVSRSFHIHDKLWTHLRRQVERLLWGQEQFGGGFCGGGNTAKIQETNTGQITWQGSLRTLGTIEALLLLTDWQPRALHFPPGDEENGLLDRSLLVPIESNSKSGGQMEERLSTRDYDNLPYASWLEPAWRSDKMSWMILGLAQSLAFELGVFDTNHFNCRHEHGPESECARKRRVRHLVLVYIAQTSGRMGIQSSLNVEDWETDAIWDKTSRKQDHPNDLMQKCWVHIARIMNRANREIFSSHQFTKELTASGRYKDSIATFTPLLENWMNEFERLKFHIHPVMQCILLMEYEYARLYINSLGLQKVVESWVEGGATMRRGTLLKISEENKPFIDEVTEAALNILDLVIDGIAVQGFLRNAPVRTYLRSLSGMMFTLKRFSLGIHEELVRKCLQRLERTTELLSDQVVDDVHLASSTSRLVQNIVGNVKQTLIRVQIPGTGSAGPSREQSVPPSPHGHDGVNDTRPQQQPLATHAIQPKLEFYGTGPDPLAGIQARSMADLDSQTFVPPPNFGDHDLDFPLPDDVNMGSTMDLAGGDWLALPLDNLWGGDEATVDQGFGGIGPTLGGRDLLEAITNRNYNQMQWNGGQTFGFL